MKIKDGGVMDIEKEREAFEEYMLRMTDGSFNTTKNHLTDQYTFGVNQTFWVVWQAAKAQAVPEWFDYTKQSPQIDGNYQIFIKGEQITAKWVSRFGFADPIEGDALRQELITHWAMQPQPPKAQEPAND